MSIRKFAIALFATIVAATAFAAGNSFLDASGDVQASRQARSVHLWWLGLPDQSDEVCGRVRVIEEQTNSYFMAIGFDGGYMGIQNLKGEHVGIFSIWDTGSDVYDFSAKPENVNTGLQARVVYAADGVDVSRFGGEGTGVRMLFGCEWQKGSDVTFRVTCTPDGDLRSLFTGYIGDGKIETKIAAVSIPNHGKKLYLSKIHSFVEDFWRNGLSKDLVRKAEFTGYCARNVVDGKMVNALGAMFTADRNTLMSIDSGPVVGGAFLQTGGDTRNLTVPLGKAYKILY